MVMLISLYFLTRPDSKNQTARRGKISAKLIQFNGDVRAKFSDDVMWFPGEQDMGLQIGDSVFSGKKSNASVKMSDALVIELGQNSMITIRDHRGTVFASLDDGLYQFKVSGSAEVLVNGQLTKLIGEGLVELEVERQNPIPRLRPLSGQVALQTPESLREDRRRELAGTRVALPKIIEGRTSVRHSWVVPDFFEERSGGTFARKNEIPELVEESFTLGWEGSDPKPLTVEVSGPQPGQIYTLENASNPVLLRQLFIGENQIRVARDNSLWSDPIRFQVDGEFSLEMPSFDAALSLSEVDEADSPARHTLKWTQVTGAAGYLLETSSRSDFADSTTKRVLSNRLRITLHGLGRSYARVWAVDERVRLSPPSVAIQLVNRIKKSAPIRQPAQAPVEPLAQKSEPTPPPVVESAPATLTTPLKTFAQKLNRMFNRGKLQLESSLFAMYSTVQSREGEAAPIAGMLGARW